MKRSASARKNIYNELTEICKGSEALLVGLTGGIATGKSSVAEIFGTLGAVIIDFDILARKVVEPGRKSWKLITGFFGNGILNPDKTIDRKKLSGVVFNDIAKREKLESFTHPYIWDEFIKMTAEAVLNDRKAVIIAVIPLLFEGDMQGMFSKIIVVYSSPENQLQRLMKRDDISKEKAQRILNAQIPIDVKARHADYIIKNDSLIEEACKDTYELWEKLKQLQENREG